MTDQLDQLWYTWSTSGLGSHPVGYRVRAASPGLHDIESLRYRKLDRYLRYDLPQGIDDSTFDPSTAPIALAFVNNGDERILVRRVFRGRDIAGRQSVYFSHLIAGLPKDFTARDAICLWHWSEWKISEEGKSAHDTYLSTIAYEQIKAGVQKSQPQNVALVHEQLSYLLQIILLQGLPAHVTITGHSALIAALLYGLTHALPMTLLGDLSFSTYESETQGREERLVGTISAAELAHTEGLPTLHLQYSSSPAQPDAETQPISTTIQRYIETVLTQLNTQQFRQMIADAESQSCRTIDNLLDLYELRFLHGPLNPRQLIQIVTYPQYYHDTLLDPERQQQAAFLLVQDAGLQDGTMLFEKVAQALATAQKQGREALTGFIEGVVEVVVNALESAVLRDDELTRHRCCGILTALVPPAQNASIWLNLLTRLTKEPLYARIRSDALWELQVWLLQNAVLMRPQPERQQVRPWLDIPSWEKLDRVLSLEPSMPENWTFLVIYQRVIASVAKAMPRSALPVIRAHEAQFKQVLKLLIQQPNREAGEVVTYFFRALIEYEYANRIDWLVFLLAGTKEPLVIERIFAFVPFYTSWQLTAPEINAVLEACEPEAIAQYGTLPTLINYIQGYVRNFTPGNLSRTSARQLLRQLSGLQLPDTILLSVNSWLCIADFLDQTVIDLQALGKAGQALYVIISGLQEQARKAFTATLIGLLVNQVQDVVDLAFVVEELGTVLSNSRWEFLRLMAAEAGQAYARRNVLSRLTPYLYIGVREAIRSQQSSAAVDEYFGILYAHVGPDALKRVDEMVASDAWPENIRLMWNTRRKQDNVVSPRGSGLRQFLSHPQKQSAESRMEKALETPSSQRRGVQQQGQPQGKLVLPGPASAAGQESVSRVSVEQQAALPFAVIGDGQQSISLSLDLYQKTHHIMKYMLPYWIYYLQGIQIKKSSKSLATEIELLRGILLDLQDSKRGQQPLMNLAEYLVDNSMIQREIDRLVKAKKASSAFDVSERLPIHLKDLQVYVGGQSEYRRIFGIFGQEDIYWVLLLLFRRCLFIDYLENERTKLQVWLSQERRKASIQYYNIPG